MPNSPIFQVVPMVFFVEIPNLPEWAIPMIKVIPRIYFDDNQINDIGIPTLTAVNCQHFWQIQSNQDDLGNSLPSTIKLKVIIDISVASVLIEDIAVYPSTYLDIDLVFVNERTAQEINTNKT